LIRISLIYPFIHSSIHPPIDRSYNRAPPSINRLDRQLLMHIGDSSILNW